MTVIICITTGTNFSEDNFGKTKSCAFIAKATVIKSKSNFKETTFSMLSLNENH